MPSVRHAKIKSFFYLFNILLIVLASLIDLATLKTKIDDSLLILEI